MPPILRWASRWITPGREAAPQGRTVSVRGVTERSSSVSDGRAALAPNAAAEQRSEPGRHPVVARWYGLALRIAPGRRLENGGLPSDWRKRSALNRISCAIAPCLLLLLAWEVIARIVVAARGVHFPNAWATGTRLVKLLAGEHFLAHSFYTHIADSLVRWGFGFALAMAIGIVVGICLGWFAPGRLLLMPLVHIMQTIPSLAWIPIAILLLGLGWQATVFIIFLAGVFAVILNTVAGVCSIDIQHVRAAQMLGAGRAALLGQVLLPGAAPHILSGMRVGLANGWRALIAAEMVAAEGTGLGYAIFQARWSFDYPSAFASIIVIALIGLAVEAIFKTVESRTVQRWGLKRDAP